LRKDILAVLGKDLLQVILTSDKLSLIKHQFNYAHLKNLGILLMVPFNSVPLDVAPVCMVSVLIHFGVTLLINKPLG